MKPIFIQLGCLLIFVTCTFGMCSKEDTTDSGNSTNGNSLPDDNTSYIGYYAIPDDIGVTSPHYFVATGSSPLTISTYGDTSRVNFNFTNNKLIYVDRTYNLWNMCSLTYDLNGHDSFDCYSEWTGGTQGALVAGNTYNFSYRKDGVGTLPTNASRGEALYHHFGADNKLIVSYSTYPGGNGVNIKEGYLYIDKIENNKASGSFQFGFRAGCARDNGVPYGTNVTGIFNKIPISK